MKFLGPGKKKISEVKIFFKCYSNDFKQNLTQANNCKSFEIHFRYNPGKF